MWPLIIYRNQLQLGRLHMGLYAVNCIFDNLYSLEGGAVVQR